jgi:hypothetical protein
MKSPFIFLRRIPQSVPGTLTNSWQYLTTRLLRSASVSIIFVLTFCVGLVSAGLAKQSIPKTVFTNPIPTLSLMKNFPVGESVRPKNTPQARELFEQFGWWHEPATVVGYETITYKQELITLCQIRTHRGEGHLLTVNPSWFEVPQAP